MDDKTLELLLSDARERYKAEFDRGNQLYTRCGVYLAALAIYMGALARFFDKPPAWIAEPGEVLFIVGAGVMGLATIVAATMIVAALWGRTVSYGPPPSSWKTYAASTQAWLDTMKDGGWGIDPKAPTLEQDVREKMRAGFADATDLNLEVNEKRFGYLNMASRALAVGFAGLILSSASYSYLALSGAMKPAAAEVHLVDPVQVCLHNGCVTGSGEREVSVSGSGGSGGGETRPAPPPPKPEPPPIRTVKDGNVRPPPRPVTGSGPR